MGIGHPSRAPFNHFSAAAIRHRRRSAKATSPAICAAWFQAIEEGNIATFENLLNTYHIDPNTQNNAGIYALHWAIIHHHLSIVQKLLAAGANPTLQDGKGQTALHVAAQHNQVQIVDYLIAQKVNLNIQDKDKQTALHLAIYHNHSSIALSLINNPTSLLHLPDANRQTPLHLALLWTCDNSIAKALIEKKMPLDVQDILGNTPLGLAALNHNADMVNRLVASNADVNLANNYLETPLHLVLNRSLAPTSALPYPNSYALYTSGHPFYPSHYPRYPVGHALFPPGYLLYPEGQYTQKNRLAIVQALHQAGAKVNVQDHYGNTPLHYTAYFNNLPALEVLAMENAPYLNAKNHQQETALHIATRRRYVDMVEKLLMCKADPTIRTGIFAWLGFGDTALDIAKKQAHLELIALLSNADIFQRP